MKPDDNEPDANLSDAELDAATGGRPDHNVHAPHNAGPNWASDNQNPKETVTFAYGGLQIPSFLRRFF
jgi:hypothetical protein